jgi:hypothetical protein
LFTRFTDISYKWIWTNFVEGRKNGQYHSLSVSNAEFKLTL